MARSSCLAERTEIGVAIDEWKYFIEYAMYCSGFFLNIDKYFSST